MKRTDAYTGPAEGRTAATGLLAVAAAVTLVTAGCQTLHRKDPAATAPPATTQGAGGSQGAKSDFHSTVGPEQEFQVHLDMGRMYETQGANEAAVAEYQKATDVCEKRGSILPRGNAALGPAQLSTAQRRMAGALDRMGRFAQAEPHYNKALKLAPKDAKVWNDVGYSYYVQNRLADAERALKTAQALDPNDNRVLTNLGLALAARGKYDEALAALSRAGGPAVGHANLGYLLAALGKTDLARQHYQTAVTLQPQLAPARQALARLDAPAAARPEAVATSARPRAVPMPPAVAVASKVKDAQVTRTSDAPTPPALPPSGALSITPPTPITLQRAGTSPAPATP